jgi:DNA-binding SARP family transcriptional activator
MLHLHLLGRARVFLKDGPVTGFVSDKVRALLSYLAMNPGGHQRSSLAGYLWGEMPENRAWQFSSHQNE